MALASRHPGARNYLGVSHFVENLSAPLSAPFAGFNCKKPEAVGYISCVMQSSLQRRLFFSAALIHCSNIR